jgi:hypothetical protein
MAIKERSMYLFWNKRGKNSKSSSVNNNSIFFTGCFPWSGRCEPHGERQFIHRDIHEHKQTVYEEGTC